MTDSADPNLVVVATAFDETEAASTALARASGWVAERPAVLRHHLRLPEGAVQQADELLKQDGWRVRLDPHGGAGRNGEQPPAGSVALLAERVQKIDALRCSQESARMAGLAQRLRGRALGWEALQPDEAGRS